MVIDKAGESSEQPHHAIPTMDLNKFDSAYACSIPGTIMATKKHEKLHNTFKENITALTKWEQRLHLHCNDNIWIVTDGGKEDTDRYYGWVIATDTTIMWEGKGYVQSKPLLLKTQHTERVGHLAAIVFLK
eukprot:14880668-Ditylum_brightwellii.AAC.1